MNVHRVNTSTYFYQPRNSTLLSQKLLCSPLRHDPLPSGVIYFLIPGGSAEKNLPAMQEAKETLVQSLGQEDPLEKETATHSSIPAWRIPWTEELGLLPSMGLQETACLKWLSMQYKRFILPKSAFYLNGVIQSEHFCLSLVSHVSFVRYDLSIGGEIVHWHPLLYGIPLY